MLFFFPLQCLYHFSNKPMALISLFSYLKVYVNEMLGDYYKYCFQMTNHENYNLKNVYSIKGKCEIKDKRKKQSKQLRDLNYNLSQGPNFLVYQLGSLQVLSVFSITCVRVKCIYKCEIVRIDFKEKVVLKTWFYYSTCETWFPHIHSTGMDQQLNLKQMKFERN